MITGIVFNRVRSCAAAYSCRNGKVSGVARRCFQDVSHNNSPHQTRPSVLSSAQSLPNKDSGLVGSLKPPKSSPDKVGIGVPTWNAAVQYTRQGKEISFLTAPSKK